jgi:hypothetical protein
MFTPKSSGILGSFSHIHAPPEVKHFVQGLDSRWSIDVLPQEETTLHDPWLLKYGKVMQSICPIYPIWKNISQNTNMSICLSNEATINKQPACDYPLFIGKGGHEFWGPLAPLAHLLVLPREALIQFQNRRNPLKNVGKKRRGLLSTQINWIKQETCQVTLKYWKKTHINIFVNQRDVPKHRRVGLQYICKLQYIIWVSSVNFLLSSSNDVHKYYSK